LIDDLLEIEFKGLGQAFDGGESGLLRSTSLKKVKESRARKTGFSRKLLSRPSPAQPLSFK